MSRTQSRWSKGEGRYYRLVQLLGFDPYDNLRFLTKCDMGTLFMRIGEPDYDWMDGLYAEVIFRAKMSKSHD
jgi:hypothetical protein